MSIKMSRLATIWSEVLGANKRIYSTIPVSLAKVWWVCVPSYFLTPLHFGMWELCITSPGGKRRRALRMKRGCFTNKIFTHWWMGILFPLLRCTVLLQRSWETDFWREMSRLWSKIHSISPDLPQHTSGEGRRLSKSEEAIDQDFISVMYGEVLPYYLHMVCTAKKLFGRENTNFI